MWRPLNLLIWFLLVVDTFFVSYAIGLNSRHVLVVDPSLGPRPALAAVQTRAPAAAPPPLPAVTPGKFQDIDTTESRLQSTVEKAAEAGILDPTKDRKFRPNDPVTRADFTRWMDRVRQVELVSPDIPSYTDVDQFNPYYRDIEGATKAYLVQGYTVKGTPQKEFKPDQYITREEFAVMYSTFSGKRGRAEKLSKVEIDQYLRYNPSTSSAGESTYKDAGDVDDWARKWVAVAHQAGVLEQCFDVNPYADTDEKKYLRPLRRMTRAEGVSILVKVYGLQVRTAEDIAKLLDSQGVFYERPGLYKEAEVMYLHALALKEKALGSASPELAQTLNNLAALYETQGEFASAEPIYRRSLNILQKDKASRNPELVRSLAGLALVYRAQGKYGESEALYKRLLEREEKSGGADSAAVASDLQNLAELSALQGKQSEAQQLHGQALSIMKKLPGSQSVAALPPLPSGRKQTDKPARPVKDKWALVIGVSKFKDPTIALKFAAKDAADFRQFLVSEEGFAADHVKLLTNAQATRDNIVGCLGEKWLGRLANPDDLVVVYISSHGSTTKEDVGVNFLVAHDTNKDSLIATGIPMQWLSQQIKEQVHCNRILLVLDVCHAGAAATAEKGLTREAGFDVDKVAVGTGQAVLCSSLADQLSWESKKYQNSVFTRNLIEAFRSKGPLTRLQEAFEFLQDKVRSEVLRDRYEIQTPVLKKAWEGDDIVLSVSPTSPRPGLSEPPAGK